MSNPLAIQAYRQLLRATKVAFRSDIPVLTAARAQIREGFEKNKSIQDAEQAAEEIKKLNDVSTFLIKNIVQGEKQDKDDRYYLNFHDKTELGDNETIKQGKKNMGSLAGVKAKKRPQ